MLSAQSGLVFRWSLVVVCYLLLPMTEICGRTGDKQHHTSHSSGSAGEAVKLVQGSNRCSGRLEVKSGRSWASVCNTFFSFETAAVACRDLDCGFADVYFTKLYDNHTNTIWSHVFNCEGNENHLKDCPTAPLNASEDFPCTHTYLSCINRPHEPAIYVTTQHWNTQKEAQVFKGHRFAMSCFHFSNYKTRSFRLKAGGENLTVQSQSLTDQTAVFLFPPAQETHNGMYECDYNYDVSPELFSKPKTMFLTVKELHDVRLVEGKSRCAGRLEVQYEAEWRPVSYRRTWRLKEAAVVCRQLDCGKAISTGKVEAAAELLPVWRFYSDCNGSESALLDCGAVRKWNSSSSTEVTCSDILLQPDIALYYGHSGRLIEEEAAEILKGYSFTINCSVEPQYPGGYFQLVFTGFKRNLTITRGAVNHSASFSFPGADESHQGNFSCIYRNFISNYNVSSRSRSLALTIAEYVDVMLDDGVLRDDDELVCAGKLLVDTGFKFELLSTESTVWDLQHATIVCRQLGCGSAVSTKAIRLSTRMNVARFFSDCEAFDSALLDCGTTTPWFSSSVVQVNCTGPPVAAGQN